MWGHGFCALKNYTSPEGFTTRAEREEKRNAEQKVKEKEQLREKEKRFSEWLRMSDEEKIKGNLWIWKLRFKKEQGTEPTPEQIEEKKQELISELPTPEEKRKQIFGDT